MQPRNYTINWEQLSNDELNLLHGITQHAVKVARKSGIPLDPMNTLTSLSVVHISTPLRLPDLLEADEDDLMHDVLGIIRHLDPDTGRLGDLFSPRYTDHLKAMEQDAANIG